MKLMPNTPTAAELTAEQTLERKLERIAEAEAEAIEKLAAMVTAKNAEMAALMAFREANAAVIEIAANAKAAYAVAEAELIALAAEAIPVPADKPEAATIRGVLREAFTLLQFKAKTLVTFNQPDKRVRLEWAKKYMPLLIVETVDDEALLTAIASLPEDRRPDFFTKTETLAPNVRRKDLDARVALALGTTEEPASGTPF